MPSENNRQKPDITAGQTAGMLAQMSKHVNKNWSFH